MYDYRFLKSVKLHGALVCEISITNPMEWPSDREMRYGKHLFQEMEEM